MTQLTYEESLDAYHTIFRMLRIGTFLDVGQYLVDTVRIIDFYLLFPYFIQNIRLKPSHRSLKKKSKQFENRRPYGTQPSETTMFSRMAVVQSAAFNTLAEAEILRNDDLSNGFITYNLEAISDSLKQQCAILNEKEKEIVGMLQLLINEYDLAGNDGLKARTKLIEHRYDAA